MVSVPQRPTISHITTDNEVVWMQKIIFVEDINKDTRNEGKQEY